MKLFLHRHSNHTSWQSGFSLMEILVVLSCIVVLALIAYTDLYGSIEKARIARLIRFESQVDHALGPALVGEWTFDDLTTNQTTVKDLSTQGNDLSVCRDTNTGGTTCAVGQDCFPTVSSGQCLQGAGMGQCFDTTGTAPNRYWLGTTHSATLGAQGGKPNKTIGIWVKLDPGTGLVYPGGPIKYVLVEKYQEYAVKLWSGAYGANTADNQIYIEYPKYTSYTPPSGYTYGDKAFFNASGGVPKDGKWHYIVVVFGLSKSQPEIAVYLDGAKEKQSLSGYTYIDPPQTAWGNFSIGRNAIAGATACAQTTSSGNPFTTGLIDRVRVYNEAFSI